MLQVLPVFSFQFSPPKMMWRGIRSNIVLWNTTKVPTRTFTAQSNTNLLSLESTLDELSKLLRKTSSSENQSTSFAPLSNRSDEILEKEEQIIEEEEEEEEIVQKVQKLTLEDLKYLHLYPRKVQQWVVDAKTPYGYYNENGEWELSFRKEKDIQQDKEMLGNIKLNVKKLEVDIENSPYKDIYRFGITKEEIEQCHPKLKRFLSLSTAPNSEIMSYRIQQLVKKYGKSEVDTGSVESQSKF